MRPFTKSQTALPSANKGSDRIGARSGLRLSSCGAKFDAALRLTQLKIAGEAIGGCAWGLRALAQELADYLR